MIFHIAISQKQYEKAALVTPKCEGYAYTDTPKLLFLIQGP
jgi:hypothetical protein